jgi:hypothetical protein
MESFARPHEDPPSRWPFRSTGKSSNPASGPWGGIDGGAFALTQMYVRQIPKSGRTPDDLLRYLGLSAQDIMKTAVEMLAMAAG